VVRAGQAPPSLEALRRFGEAHLARFKLPERLVVVDELPLTPAEKVDRRAVARQVDEALG
jgi:non-ribosomal peptide synthetase component E (peptide arylation enzyme)